MCYVRRLRRHLQLHCLLRTAFALMPGLPNLLKLDKFEGLLRINTYLRHAAFACVVGMG